MRNKRKIKSASQKTRLGPVQQKILLLLLGGFALSCVRSPNAQWRILKGMREQWKEINKQVAERAIATLYESKLISMQKNADGTTTIILSEEGKKRALTYDAWNMKILQPKQWDKKWRVIIFDIPETERGVRDSLRTHLTHLGFYKIQQSAFVYPFDCRDEIDFLVKLHEAKKHVRFIVAEHIDNEEHLKKIFTLS